MCKQKLISNKFDLELVTTFSSYWCTAIFTKSRSLHYVLKKQEEIDTQSERHWRKEQRLPNRHTKEKNNVRKKRRSSIKPGKDHSIKRRRRNHIQGTTLPAQKTTRRNKTATKHFPERHAEQRRWKRRSHKLTVHAKDLRIEMQKGRHSREKRRFQKQKNDVNNDAHGNSQTTTRIWKKKLQEFL